MRAEVERWVRADEPRQTRDQLVTVGGAKRFPHGRRHVLRRALIAGALDVVAELLDTHQRRVWVALAHHAPARRRPRAPVRVAPAAPLERATQGDAAQPTRAEVGRVGRDLPATVPLAGLLLARALPARVVDD